MSIFRESFLEEPVIFDSMLESINVELLQEAFDIKSVIKKAKELWDRFVKWFKEQVKKIKEIIDKVLKKNKTNNNKSNDNDENKDREIKYKSFSYKSKSFIPTNSDYILNLLTTKKIKEYINSSRYNNHKSITKYGPEEVREHLQKHIDLLRDSAERMFDLHYIDSNDIEIEEQVSKIIANNTTLKGIIYNNIKDEQEYISKILKILNSSINLLEGYIPEYNDYIKDVTNIYNNCEEKTIKNEESIAIVKCMQFDISNLQKFITSYQQILIKAKSVYEFNEKALRSL